jgi:hypothetical protein
MRCAGNVHGARPSSFPLWHSPIAASQMPSHGHCTSLLSQGNLGRFCVVIMVRSLLSQGNLGRFCRRLSAPCLRQIMGNWESWKSNTETSNNHRMLQQLSFHAQHSVQAASVQDLNPRPCADNIHASVLALEMMAIKPGENPTRTLTWKALAFLSHIKRRTNDDRFPW